ncbi:transmembrane protein, putative (macronuclear) [Tetrahymena thermophila SB210]|uniref:Transmembrane protein, putative n=1 Tax=Tetrahymena thermophila (strain SB210) TaxID=312017 RepID=I7LVK7_TETTS|nr:transmembrane protein, putative [Tetrahymena thermophila SB210]EAR98415.1 transmembrane protein, putative [Tetrahymena thermophila SB210]|eukprot:XP_001018660.1 transmembrane protein, putative [Tetrahymena thermophila SB210]
MSQQQKIDIELGKNTEDQLYLSSNMSKDINNLETSANQLQIGNETIQIEEEQEIENQCLSMTYYYLYPLVLVFQIFVAILIFLLNLIQMLLGCKKQQILLVIWLIISSTALIYVAVNYFFLLDEQSHIQYFYQEFLTFLFAIIIVQQHIILVTVKINKNLLQNSILDKFNTTLNTFYFNEEQEIDDRSFSLDYNFRLSNIQLQIEQDPQYSKTALFFSTFTFDEKPSKLNLNIKQFYQKFDEYISPSFKNYLLLSLIITIKFVFIYLYIQKNTPVLSEKDYIDFAVVAIGYYYVIFMMNKNLGNKDLKRKIKQMRVFNNLISFEEINSQNFNQKLDITCLVSIKTWDNARRYILSYKNDYLLELELSYIWLILSYIFDIVGCISYYFDINWIIPENSDLLNPVLIIANSFNFIFFTIFLLFRIYQGSKYNQTFEELDQSVSKILDVYTDLHLMHQEFFKQKKEKGKLVDDKFSVYGLIIKRIKQLSKYYIKNQIPFQNKVYSITQKEDLRRKMVSDLRKGFKKLKQSIQQDKESYTYSFLNLLQVDIQSFLLPLTVALVTTLPTIVPKFIEFYKKKQ